MQTASVSRPILARANGRFDAGAAGIWVLAFALPVYLALEGGGYDGIVRGQIGIAIWWAIVVGCAVGMLPLSEPTRAGWAAVALLGAFAAWSLLSASWSSSSERSVAEAARLATHLGVLAIGVFAIRRDATRNVLNALATAVAVVGGLALLSRLHPSWFPVPQTGDFLPRLASRLSYPLNYWNALGAFLAMGVPLLLFAATSARTLAARAAAGAAIPIVGTAVYLTYSRGSLLALAVGLAVLLAASPARLSALAALVIGGAGGIVLALSVAQRGALADGFRTDVAYAQGDQVLVLALLVMAGCALLQVAVALVDRHAARPPALRRSPRRLPALAIAGALVVVFAVGAGVPSELADRWERFKDPQTGLAKAETNTASRLTAASGKGRYQYWQSSLHALEARPLGGVGAGTFEFWWAAHSTTPGFVRNAHSLWFETAGEVGLVGLALLVALFGVAFAAGVLRLRGAPAQRPVAAAALAALAAFGVSASFDWVWQVTAIPVVALLLTAVLVAGSGRRPGASPPRRARILLIALGAVCMVVIAVPLAGLTSLRESQSHAERNDPVQALSSAANARAVQSYAATPPLQEALLLEQVGRLDEAVRAARQATVAERTNWRTWLILSRVRAERGEAAQAVRAFRRARSLNPNSPIFR